MYGIQHKMNSSLMINIISTFHMLNKTIDPDDDAEPVIECMFLQEKIQAATQLDHFAEQLKGDVQKKRVSKIDALNILTHCYEQVASFNTILHEIGYIHGDISLGNILYGSKISVQISLTNSTAGKIYKYELVDTSETNSQRCYIIDFGSAKSKNVLTISDSIEQETQDEMICQTFLFAHPFLYEYIAYPQGRLTWKYDYQLTDRETDMNLTEDEIDNVIWSFAVSCEKYAVATTFLFTLEQTEIFDDVFNNNTYGRQLGAWAYNVTFFDQIPKFGTHQQNILILQLQLIQKLCQKVIAVVFKKLQHDAYENEKSVVETMIVSMIEAMHWYPSLPC